MGDLWEFSGHLLVFCGRFCGGFVGVLWASVGVLWASVGDLWASVGVCEDDILSMGI